MRLQIGMAVAVAGLIVLPLSRARADGDVPGHVLVYLRTDNDVPDINDDYGTQEEDYVQTTDIYSFAVPETMTAAQFASTLRSDARVRWAETDKYILPPEVDADPFHFAFDSGPNPGAYVNQKAYQQVNMGNVNRLSKGASVIVAVLDTGATFTHPALAKNYLPGYNVLDPNQSAADIADGVTNVAVGHGTMVAGIIVHLAPAVKILPVRVLNGDGVGTILDVMKGIDYAVTHGARVIDMSFGGRKTSHAFDAAINEADDANIVLVSAGGNDGKDAPYYPAGCNDVIGVASIEANDARSSWSNFGRVISAAAPGNGIRSTYYTGGYADWSGTSFAAPFIAGEAALMIARNPHLTGSQVGDIIGQTAQELEDGLGDGLIDILRGVSSIK